MLNTLITKKIKLNEWNIALMNITLSIFSDNSLDEFQCHNNCAKLHFCRSLQTQSSCLDECQTDALCSTKSCS